MKDHFLQLSMSNPILQFLILIVVLLFSIHTTKKVTQSYIVKNAIEPHRRKLILNLIYLLFYTLTLFFALLIFGFSIKEMAVLASSVLAVLGIGFFAQWSILSNLTASIILFFYHPMRIGDTIKIIEKDMDLTGRIKNITGFYVLLHIPEGNREISIPNAVILYKSIELIKNTN